MRALVAALGKLRDAGGEIPSSRLTQAQQRLLEQWGSNTKAVGVRPAGRGKVYYVAAGREQAIQNALDEASPGVANGDIAELHPRAANLAAHRSTKAGTMVAHHHLLPLKPAGQGATWSSLDRSFQIVEACEHTGAALLPILPADDWRTSGDLWLVENQAMFDNTTWLPPASAGTVTYFAGEIHSRLLAWLESRPRAGRVVLFPDYDANGLCNLERLMARCACPAELYLFDGWEQALVTYGDRGLHRTNLETFHAVARRLSGPAKAAAAPLLDAMIHSGMSLEQESAFLAPLMRSPRPKK